MATEIMNGKGVVFGLTNDGSAISMSGYATFILDSADLAHSFDLDTVKDEAKYDAALIASNGHKEITITWTPSGATRAAAKTTMVTIAPLAKVTLAHFQVGAFNGDWVYVGGQSLKISQGVGKISLKIRQYDDATQNTSLTTIVTG